MLRKEYFDMSIHIYTDIGKYTYLMRKNINWLPKNFHYYVNIGLCYHTYRHTFAVTSTCIYALLCNLIIYKAKHAATYIPTFGNKQVQLSVNSSWGLPYIIAGTNYDYKCTCKFMSAYNETPQCVIHMHMVNCFTLISFEILYVTTTPELDYIV